METLKKLKYLGKKPLPISLALTLLSKVVVIDEDGWCVCSEGDAKTLLETNPKMFLDGGEVVALNTEQPSVPQLYEPPGDPPSEVGLANPYPKPKPTRSRKTKKG